MKKIKTTGGYSFGISNCIDSDISIDFIDISDSVYNFEQRAIKKRHLTFRLLRVLVPQQKCGDNT